MCGRYYIAQEDRSEELERILTEARRRGGASVKQGEVCPSETAPVIANSRAGRPTVYAMRWGFALNGALIINARSETAAGKPLFHESMARRRCLVPASCYFEWEKRDGGRMKYAIGAGQTIYMAGLYRHEDDGATFVILTRAPAKSIAFIHNRMPVILPASCHAAWLGGEDADATLTSATLNVTFSETA